MYTDQNIKTIEEMEKIFRFSENTKTNYINHLKLYSNYHDMSLEGLLNEAEEDEENHVRKRKRRINQRLYGFQDHLINTPYEFQVGSKVIKGNYNNSSINTILRSVISMYHAFEIETPRMRLTLPEEAESVDDTITYDMIRKALKSTSNLKHKAIIKLMACSGFDSNDVRSITVGMFLEACKDYTSSETIHDQLIEIMNNDNVIPCFHFKRGKTSYDHFTFATPEATHAIAEYLLTLEDIGLDDKIFEISVGGFRKLFSIINDKCGFGWTSKGTRRKFHSHGLRRFLATQLVGETINGIMIDSMIIEWFLGHKVPATTEAYYKRNPLKLREIYINFVPKLTFESETIVNSVDSPEYARLKDELQQYKNLIGDVAEIRKLKEELLEQYDNIER